MISWQVIIIASIDIDDIRVRAVADHYYYYFSVALWLAATRVKLASWINYGTGAIAFD